MDKYRDMLNMPRPVSKKHPPMPVADRAAQFSPFAALRGYGDAVAAAAMPRVARRHPAEDREQEIAAALALLAENGAGAAVVVTYFVPNPPGSNTGTYTTARGTLAAVDHTGNQLVISAPHTLFIPFGDIWAIKTPLLHRPKGE